MIALDTNILARYLLNDDAGQAKGLRLLFVLPNFKPKQFETLCYALQWFEQGMDFGDALHLAQGADEEGFFTFDKPLGKLAESIGAMPKVEVLKA